MDIKCIVIRINKSIQTINKKASSKGLRTMKIRLAIKLSMLDLTLLYNPLKLFTKFLNLKITLINMLQLTNLKICKALKVAAFLSKQVRI